MSRLTKDDKTIKHVLNISLALYKTNRIDDKLDRERLDIIGGRVIGRRGLFYNRSTKRWEQDSREVRFDFTVRSDPVSYKKKDTLPVHVYPVTFLLKDFNLGFNSPFRWRTGGLKRWKKSVKLKEDKLLKNNKRKSRKDFKSEKEWEKEKERYNKLKEKLLKEQKENAKKNQRIMEQNIKNGLQGNFIFHLMWVLKQNNLLFGPLTCKNSPPKETNKKYEYYFDKTALYIVLRVLPRIFSNPKLNQTFGKR